MSAVMSEQTENLSFLLDDDDDHGDVKEHEEETRRHVCDGGEAAAEQ